MLSSTGNKRVLVLAIIEQHIGLKPSTNTINRPLSPLECSLVNCHLKVS